MSRLERLKASKEAFERFVKENAFSFGIRYEAMAWYDHEIESAELSEKWQEQLGQEEAKERGGSNEG